jgi:hypothetical protein
VWNRFRGWSRRNGSRNGNGFGKAAKALRVTHGPGEAGNHEARNKANPGAFDQLGSYLLRCLRFLLFNPILSHPAYFGRALNRRKTEATELPHHTLEQIVQWLLAFGLALVGRFSEAP